MFLSALYCQYIYFAIFSHAKNIILAGNRQLRVPFAKSSNPRFRQLSNFINKGHFLKREHFLGSTVLSMLHKNPFSCFLQRKYYIYYIYIFYYRSTVITCIIILRQLPTALLTTTFRPKHFLRVFKVHSALWYH